MHYLKFLIRAIQSPYRDLSIRCIAALVASHIVVSHGFGVWSVIYEEGYVFSLISSAIIAFLIFTSINIVTQILDKILPWKYYTIARVIGQFIMGVVAMAFMAYGLAAMLFSHVGESIEQTDYMRYDFYLIMIYIVLINAYYYLCYRFQLKNQLKKAYQVLLKQNRDLAIKNAPAHLKDVDFEALAIEKLAVACICSIGESLRVYSFNAEYFVSTEKHEKLFKQYHLPDYIRLNRFCLIHRILLLGYKEASSRRLIMIFREPFNHLIPEERKFVSQANREEVLKFIKSAD